MSAKGEAPKARHQIAAMMRRELTWAKAIGEWVDNAAGNGAKQIVVKLSPTLCQVKDDGHGCTEEMFKALQSLFSHLEDESNENPTSRYGIGAKDGFLWVGGPTELYSIRDTARFTTIDWLAFSDDWEYPEPIIGQDAYSQCKNVGLVSTGTVLRMPKHRRQVNRPTFDAVVKALNEQHWAAVETGVKIRIEYLASKSAKPISRTLSGKPVPQLMEDKSIDRVVDLPGGRSIRIVGGVLAQGVRVSDPGFEYIFGHRVIVKCGGLGAGDLSFERVYFRVFLLGDKTKWEVNTNKTGLHDHDESIVARAVFKECRPLLEMAQDEAFASFEEQELEQELSKLVTESHRKKKAKRNQPENDSGAAEETGRGGTHRRAGKLGECDGNCEDEKDRKPRRHSVIEIKLIEFSDKDEHLAGKALVRERIVRLNKLHPAIAACVSERAIRELHVVANFFWANAWCAIDDKGNRLAEGMERDKPEDKYSKMLTGLFAAVGA